MGKKSMKKSMKAMKAMGSGMKRKAAMKKSKIAKGKRAKSSVFRGTKEKTVSGLKKSDLTRNKLGKVVSKTISPRKEKLSEEWVGQMDQGRCRGAKIDGHQGMAECGWKVRQRAGAVEKSPVYLPQINTCFEIIGFKLGSSGVCPLWSRI